MINMYRILLVEDDRDIREMLVDYFTQKSEQSMLVETAADGQSGLERAYENAYDLLLLDVMLPEVDGFEICREVRRGSDVPVIFLTARASEADMLSAYALGCDDYVVKPFPLSVLYEKVCALIKRDKGLVRAKALSAGTLTLNPNNGIVVSDGKEICLTAKEYAILKILLEKKGSIVSRDTLLRGVWGYDFEGDERVSDSHIKNLRRALGDNARLIKTVVGRGYRIEDK